MCTENESIKKLAAELAVSNPKKKKNVKKSDIFILSKINDYPWVQNFDCAPEWHSELWVVANMEAMWEYWETLINSERSTKVSSWNLNDTYIYILSPVWAGWVLAQSLEYVKHTSNIHWKSAGHRMWILTEVNSFGIFPFGYYSFGVI